MRIEKTVCDICGVDIPDDDFFDDLFTPYLSYLLNYGNDKCDDADACASCRSKIDAMNFAYIEKMKKGES